jgi:uncharacterized RDD family membrane protein YckC
LDYTAPGPEYPLLGETTVMSREILVVTPENIEIEYELAGIGTRFLANMIDIFIQSMIFLGGAVAIGLVIGLLALFAAFWPHSFGWVHPLTSLLEGVITAVAFIGAFLVMWGYFVWFELRWNGQTPGKRQVGLRVIRDGGYPVNIYAVLTRNLLRVIDGMPAITLGLLIGGLVNQDAGLAALGGLSILTCLFCMLFSARYQRLGDFVAGTMVVKQRAPRVPTLEALAPPPRLLPEHLASYALADIGRHVYEMTVPEYRAVRHYIDRRWQLPPLVQQEAAIQLAVPLMQHLDIRPPAGVLRVDYANFLEYLAVAFEQYRGVK